MKVLRLFSLLLIPFYLMGCLGGSQQQYSYQTTANQSGGQNSTLPSEGATALSQQEKPDFEYYIKDTPKIDVKNTQVAFSHRNSDVQTVKISKTDRVRKTVTKHPGYHFSSSDPFAQDQNTESMIEEKLFKLVQDAYYRRDQVRFLKLYSFFFESFPNTKRKSELSQYHKKFFYSENRKLEYLDDALVELTYPKAKSIKELNDYFRELKKSKISTVQVNVVSLIDTPLYLFGNGKKGVGYYFSTHNGMTADNILEKIVTAAHANNIKLFASFPLRHHPWLGNNEIYIMDESWNAIQNKTTPNSKLDLFNPDSRLLLEDLIDALLATNIDGIIFKDDFTYDLYEGFSNAAIQRYQEATGRNVALSEMFIPIDSDSGQGFDVVTTQDFNDLSKWRAGEVSQLLWDLSSRIKKIKPDFKVGLEVTPEMFLDRNLSMKWYSTSLHYLKNQKMDFYILKWRKYNSEAESDIQSYKSAIAMLKDNVPLSSQIYGKIPLSQTTQNVIRLNDRIREQMALKEDFEGIKTAIGPVNRLNNQDLINMNTHLN